MEGKLKKILGSVLFGSLLVVGAVYAASLPTVGGDSGTWGTVLNAFLQVSHDNDGHISVGSINSTMLEDTYLPADGSVRMTDDFELFVADTVIDCDGSATVTAPSSGCGDAEGTVLVSFINKVDFDNDDAQDETGLCVDSITEPTVVAQDDDTGCGNGAGGTVILGTPDGSETIGAAMLMLAGWDFVDTDGDGFLDDGESLYIDVFPSELYYSGGGTGIAYFGQVGIGTVTPSVALDVTGGITASGTITATDYYSGVHQGITDTTSYWMCTDSDCSAKCQVQINDGLITGCTGVA